LKATNLQHVFLTNSDGVNVEHFVCDCDNVVLVVRLGVATCIEDDVNDIRSEISALECNLILCIGGPTTESAQRHSVEGSIELPQATSLLCGLAIGRNIPVDLAWDVYVAVAQTTESCHSNSTKLTN
jgi:hypothetical protein